SQALPLAWRATRSLPSPLAMPTSTGVPVLKSGYARLGCSGCSEVRKRLVDTQDSDDRCRLTPCETVELYRGVGSDMVAAVV
ncbi:MAG: hypothetical protein ACPH3N_14185, partial [Alcanivorax sediminis]